MIRTYSRKPPECRYIDGLMQLCRLCLRKAGEAVQIFSGTDGVCSPLSLRIMFCVGLEINRDDSLPNVICMECYKELEQYYAFRKRCEASYHKLKSHLLAVHSRRALEAITIENVTKDIDVNQDENMNVSDLGLLEGESYKTEQDGDKGLDVEPEFVVSNVHSITSESTDKPEPEQNEVIQEIRHTIEPQELSSLITSVLVKLRILTQQDDQLDLTSEETVRIQLETGDGVIRMELAEEDEEDVESQLYVDFPTKVEEETIVSAADSFSAPEDTFTQPKRRKGRGGPRVLLCGSCGRACASRSALRRHARTHSGERPFACAVCARAFAQKEVMRRHMLVHKGESRSALRRHARTHSGERPFACAVCARAFAQKEVMRRHMLVHKEERPYKCTSCPKSFTQRNALELHQRSHLQPHERSLALHSCPHCPKLFLYASGLSRHMLVHSGRVYECGACHRQFADRSSVLRHVRHARHEHEHERGHGHERPGDSGQGGA